MLAPVIAGRHGDGGSRSVDQRARPVQATEDVTRSGLDETVTTVSDRSSGQCPADRFASQLERAATIGPACDDRIMSWTAVRDIGRDVRPVDHVMRRTSDPNSAARRSRV